MKLSIVIPIYNNFNFTKACVDDLLKLSGDNEIIIVDNGSTDKTKDYKFPCKVIRNKKNTGFAYAVNQGYTESSGEYVMFLNNDIRVQRDHAVWINPIIEAAEDGSIVGPTGGLLDENLNFVKEVDKLLDSKYFYMCGWNITAKREVWEKLKINDYPGPFTEEFTTYFEDNDLSYRAKELGIPFKIVSVPVFHFKRMTGKQLGLSDLYSQARTKFINKWAGRI